HQTQTLSENLMVVEAMQEFKTAYNQLQQSRTPTDTPTDLEDTQGDPLNAVTSFPHLIIKFPTGRTFFKVYQCQTP
ncbi:hypothetical protein, partial [Moorena sp. SIO2C4]|uniref:hypothetical protein n=1 Tax=Moorena sp. SIO2C4 TaxID=2607824 RepID=UPI00257EE9B0